MSGILVPAASKVRPITVSGMLSVSPASVNDKKESYMYSKRLNIVVFSIFSILLVVVKMQSKSKSTLKKSKYLLHLYFQW